MTLSSLLDPIEAMTLTDSRQHYGAPAPALPLLIIDSPACYAVIAMQGAQILEFTPTNGVPLLWLSPKARFVPGQAIRGGIPLCAPWFGPHPEHSSYPSHGFARNRDWQLDEAKIQEDAVLQLSFVLTADEHSRRYYPFDFTLRLTMYLGATLRLEFSVCNHSATAMPISWALHSYFPVGDLAKVRVNGLQGMVSVDNTSRQPLGPLDGELAFAGEVDRFFTNAPATQQLQTDQTVHIAGQACPTVITWNPGRDKAATMVDIGSEHFADFVCVERGAAFDDAWLIPAGERQQATMTIGG